MWQFLNNLCLILFGKNLQINTFHVDFEIRAHQAIIDVFESIKIIGCKFHLGQSWWRKVRNNYYYIIIVFINYLYCIL